MTALARAVEIPSIDSLRESGYRPRMHPNGFIQLYVDDLTRLHVWPWPLMAGERPDASPLHDHTWSMRSVVLVGSIIQSVWTVGLEHGGQPTHSVWQSAPGGRHHESPLEDTGVLVKADLRGEFIIPEGAEYEQSAFTFHTTGWNELTVTMMRKGSADAGPSCRVLVPYGSEPAEETWDRYRHPDAILWDWIDIGLTEARRFWS